MTSRTRNSVILGIVVALCTLSWLIGRSHLHAPDQAAITGLLGTWTDEGGPPGNYVRFNRVERPSGTPGLQYSDGRGRINGLLGENDAPIIWNYESLAPFRLNVIVGNRAMVVPVRLIDPDHLHLRFVSSDEVGVWSSNQVWDSPEVVRLKRIKDAIEGP